MSSIGLKTTEVEAICAEMDERGYCVVPNVIIKKKAEEAQAALRLADGCHRRRGCHACQGPA